MPANYPVYSDINSYCSAFGIDCPASGFVGEFIDEAVGEWNAAVGYTYSGASSGIYPFDPPTNNFVFTQPFQTITAVKVNGVALTEGTEYWAYAYGIKILCPPNWRNYQAITVEGTEGYSTIDQRVWNMIRNLVIWKIINANPTRVFTEIKMKDQTVKFDKWVDPYDTFQTLANEFRWL